MKHKNQVIAFYTIGVFGSSESEFFGKLMKNEIDCFCDIRRRRAVRGSEYSFVNSKRLQEKLQQLGIKYFYEIDLAPTQEIRELQKKTDEQNKVPTRQREELGSTFKNAYVNSVLNHFDFSSFLKNLEQVGAKRVVLFCVEKSAAACHRSLVAHKLEQLFPGIEIIHL